MIDALAKSSFTLSAAWSEVLWEFPLICSKSTVGWNFSGGRTNIVSAFGPSVASLVLAVI